MSDSNLELVETLQRVQISADSVATCFFRLPRGRDAYYRVRNKNPRDLTPDERAARFIYLNALCFNGLYRVNREGQFNVPLGTKPRHVLFDASAFRAASYALRTAEIEHADFEQIVDRTSSGDFVYLDPPYATGSKRTFVEYGQDIFTEKDLSRLIAALKRANRRGVQFVLSYANVPEIRAIPSKWRLKYVRARRNIAGFLGSRKTVSEVLISNTG